MSLNIGDNFKYLGKKFLDNRESFATLEDMKKCTQVPDGFLTYCQEDGKRYEFNSSNNINELTGKWVEFVINQDIEDCYYLGIEEPSDEKIWFFNSQEEASVQIKYDNPVIAELFACIQSLQDQITKLQADVEYLKVNGGGGIPVEPDSGDQVTSLYILLEDGGFFELEDGTSFLLEDGGFIILEESISAVKDNLLLLETGAELLLENGYNILIES